MAKTDLRSAYTTKSELANFKKAAEKYTSRTTSSTKAAKAALVEMGIYSKDGKLTTAYSSKVGKLKK